MIKSTPHAHTDFVDGKSSAEQVVRSAIERGFQSLGFSEHAIQPFDPRYCLNDQTERMYILQIEWLRQRYAGDIRIHLGIERDLCSTADRAKFEYVIGSMHYMEPIGEPVAVDGPHERVSELIEKVYGGDGYRFAEAYYNALAGYIEDYKPEIIGHFDLIRKPNGEGRFFDTAQTKYQHAAKQALERMVPSGALMEVNTGAMARGHMRAPYPELELLRHWRTLGGGVILSSDCHDAALIDYGFGVAEALIREAGYRSAWALNPKPGERFIEFGL